MPTRSYRLYANIIATANAAASLRIVKKGVITSINWATAGLSAAGTTYYAFFELSKQSTSTLAVNDTPQTALDMHCAVASPSASSGMGGNALHAGLQNPVDVGDTLYLHGLQAGAAPSSMAVYCNITVQE